VDSRLCGNDRGGALPHLLPGVSGHLRITGKCAIPRECAEGQSASGGCRRFEGAPQFPNLPPRARDQRVLTVVSATGFPPPIFTRTSSAGMTEDGAAGRCRGFGGVPQSPNLPPRVGVRGLKESLERGSTGRPSLMLSRWEPDDWQLDNMLGEK
jgi:hypothetical protein